MNSASTVSRVARHSPRSTYARVSIPQIEEAAIAELGVPRDASSNTIDASTLAALTASDVSEPPRQAWRADVTGATERGPARVDRNATHAPTMAVVANFGWPRSTASRRIREAPDAGRSKGRTDERRRHAPGAAPPNR